MKWEEFKEKISRYLDNELSEAERKEFRAFLAKDEKAQAEFERYVQSWEMLGDWKDLDPDPGYVSRFWTRVAQERPWHERVWAFLQAALTDRVRVSLGAAVCLVVIVGIFTMRTMVETHQTREFLAEYSGEDMEFIQGLEFAENLEMIEDLDCLEDLDLLEYFQEQGAPSA